MAQRISWSVNESRSTATYRAEQYCDPPSRDRVTVDGRVYERRQVPDGR